ncbi:MAG: glycosyltransferase [Ignavibacteriales bacterium]|nr:glycosyltransferase [Ignavibacteriales bacterium]
MSNSITTHQQPITVSKYLDKYGLKNWSLELPAEKKFNNIIVIPAIQESENIKRLLASLLDNDKKYLEMNLFVFVINNLKYSNEEVKIDNRKSIEHIRKISLKKNNPGINIGLVNASSSGLELPEKDGGVGLARKIGMDLALTQFNYSNSGKNILICLDADCTVSNNYLESIIQTFKQPNIHAAYVQYEHMLPENESEQLAIICYEIFLRYYVLGLQYANSPFAFPTIGSTMICDYESYIKVGGMNKKKAAEDFYFMEKLAKITKIKKISTAKVYPSSRGSWRVPFGTGQRVNRFFAGTHKEYLLYDPKSFDVLKSWLKIYNSKEIFDAEHYLKSTAAIHKSLYDFLVQNSFEDSWNKILKNSKSDEQKQKQKQIWFDGFRTLKLIHYLRDNGFPLVNMFEALDELLRIENSELRIMRKKIISPVEEQIEYLSLLRKLA